MSAAIDLLVTTTKGLQSVSSIGSGVYMKREAVARLRRNVRAGQLDSGQRGIASAKKENMAPTV